MNSFFRWGMIPALLVIIACGVVAFRIVFVEDADVPVPDLVGMSIVDAAEKLQQQGLLAKVDKVESAQPMGTVISQHIEPGMRVGKGKVVLIKVSRGGERAAIPDVRGYEYAEAIRQLANAGFKVEDTLRVTDELKPAGTVIAQNPAAPAQVGGARSVRLLVSEGVDGQPGMLFVPNLSGQTLELAKDVLAKSNLSLDQVLSIPTNEVPEGVVLSTTPKNGARVPFGAPITINVARLPKSGEAPVDPNLVVAPASLDEPAPKTPGTSTPPLGARSKDNPTNVKPEEKPVVDEPTPPQTQTAKNTAKIRYQVPPLSKPLALKIEIVDVNGTRILKDSLVNGTEYITMDVPFAGEARVLIHLGGEFVWQDKFE